MFVTLITGLTHFYPLEADRTNFSGLRAIVEEGHRSWLLPNRWSTATRSKPAALHLPHRTAGSGWAVTHVMDPVTTGGTERLGILGVRISTGIRASVVSPHALGVFEKDKTICMMVTTEQPARRTGDGKISGWL